MSDKVQLSPGATSREALLRTPLQVRWSNPAKGLEDMTFFRSWLVYDSDLDFDGSRSRGRINWNAIGGLALMVSVSAAGWTGVALLVQQLVR